MIQDVLDTKITNVIKETKNKLSVLLKDSKSELTSDNLRSWFNDNISALRENNKVISEKKYTEIKMDFLSRFRNKVTVDITNDTKELDSLINTHELFKNSSEKGSDVILRNLNRHLNSDKKDKNASSPLRCFKCSITDLSKLDLIHNLRVSLTMFDNFDAVIQIQPCFNCKLDPDLFKNVRIDFEKAGVSKRIN